MLAEMLLPAPAHPRSLARSRVATMALMSRFPAAWWLALGILVLNDHVLKYAGLLPGWITGKLSDITGLIVAPVLAARLARARTPRTRALAFAAVAIPFCAIKVSVPAAGALVTAIGWLGIHWRLWCDATDLLALAVLPLAWRISRVAAAGGANRSRPARAAGAVPVILGAVACLATSQWPPTGFHTAAFLANMTLEPVEVRMFRARGPLDCAAVAADPTNALASAFDPELCTHLEVGGIMPLTRSWWALEAPPDGGPPPALDPPCDAVIIRVPDLPDTLLTWQQPAAVDVDNSQAHPVAERARDGLDPHGIYLERAGDRIFAAGSPLITSQPATIALPDVACGALPDLDGGHPADSGDAGADR
jgi:hypothetical protein